MGYELWSQDIFTKGELSPYMYGRATVNEYGNGLKTAQNVLTYPTGAAGKRFGTLFQAIIAGLSSPMDLYFQTFQYLNECVYQLVIVPNNVYIFLEGILVATISTSIVSGQIYNISSTVLGSNFQICGPGLVPQWISRVPSITGNVITSVSANQFNLTTAVTAGLVLPVQFTTGGTLPTTTPQILPNVTYFVNYTSTSTAALYSSSYDAKFNINPFIITNNGSGTNTLYPLNSWGINSVTFTNLPFYDFVGGYDAVTFTPGAVVGNTTLTATGGAPFTTAHVGGAFFGAGGTARIIAFSSSTVVTIAIQNPFDSMDAIQGSLVLLAEPAWSDLRGWPQVCSSYQNRSLFANTASLPNGFWSSVTNDYINMGNLTTDDDDAISWYPSSDNINFIRFIVPYRSITVHSNTGIYSSPLSDITAITPTNFTLQLQDSTPADVLLPQAIDNQILVLSGNDAHQMLWDGINNAYTSDIVSIINEQTIRNPVDETSFADLRRAGSRFVFIVNENGSLAAFQTLISQNVSGFTPQILEQSYGIASFIQCASSSDGRCWFVCQRDIATDTTSANVFGVTGTHLFFNSVLAIPIGVATAITFTSGSPHILPQTTPPLTETQYYWAVAIDSMTIQVYQTKSDAENGVNAFVFTSEGNGGNVHGWTLVPTFTLEELTKETFLDCAVYYNGTPASTITTGTLFNAQDIKMVGDGFGFETTGFGNQAVFEAHGMLQNVSEAYIGFPINTVMEPMPLSMANGPSAKQTTLTKPKHIRTVRFMFNNTIGGTINGVPIALNQFDMANIGLPPFPARGIMELNVGKGWDDFQNPTYTIEHSDPFDIQLLGVFYSVDI